MKTKEELLSDWVIGIFYGENKEFIQMLFARHLDGWRKVKIDGEIITLERNPAGFFIYVSGGENYKISEADELDDLCTIFDSRLKKQQ